MTSHRKNLLADPDFLARASAGDVLRDALNEPAFVKQAAVADSRGNDIADPNTFIADLKSMNYYTLINKYGREVADNRSKLQRELEAQFAIRNTPRTSTEKVVDTGLDAAKAVVGFGGGLIAAATGIAGAGDEIAFGDSTVSEISTRIADATADVTGFIGDFQSDNLRDRSELIEIEGVLDRQDSKAIMDQQVARGVSPIVANMERIGRDILNTGERFYSDGVVGQSLIAGALGSVWPSAKLARGGQILATKLAARTGNRTAKRLAATVGSAAGIGIGEASGTYSDTSSFVMNLTEADMYSAPEYARLRSEGKDHEEAQRIVAASTALEASSRQLPVAAVLGLVAARFNANPIGVFKGKGLFEIYREAGIQVFEEAGQGASSVLSQNIAVSNQINAEQDLFEGFGDAVAEGGIAGLGMSGVLAAPSIARSVAVSGIVGAVDAADLLKKAAIGTIIDSEGVGRDAAGNARLKRKIKNTAGAILDVTVKGGQKVVSKIDKVTQAGVIDATGEGRDVARGQKPINIVTKKVTGFADKVSKKIKPVTKVAKKAAADVKAKIITPAMKRVQDFNEQPNTKLQLQTLEASGKAVELSPDNEVVAAVDKIVLALSETQASKMTDEAIIDAANTIIDLTKELKNMDEDTREQSLLTLTSPEFRKIRERFVVLKQASAEAAVDLNKTQNEDTKVTKETIKETLEVIALDPTKVNPDHINNILKSEDHDLTTEQIKIMKVAAEMATAVNNHRGEQVRVSARKSIALSKKPAYSNKEAPKVLDIEGASRSIQVADFVDARGHKLRSINSFGADILEAIQSKDGTVIDNKEDEGLITTADLINKFGMFVEHLRNKVAALNTSYKNRSKNGTGTTVMFRSLVAGERMIAAGVAGGANGVFVHVGSPKSVAVAEAVANDAKVAAEVYNTLVRAFPKQFPGGEVAIPKLDITTAAEVVEEKTPAEAPAEEGVAKETSEQTKTDTKETPDTTAGDETISPQAQIDEEAVSQAKDDVTDDDLVDGPIGQIDANARKEDDDGKARNTPETKAEEIINDDDAAFDEDAEGDSGETEAEETGPVTEKFGETFTPAGNEIGYETGEDILNILNVGTNTSLEYKRFAKKLFKTLVSGMNERLANISINKKDSRSLKEAILSGDKLSHIRDFKNTMLVNPKTGEYDPALLSIAVVGMIDWMSSIRSADPSSKQLRKTLYKLGVDIQDLNNEDMQNILHGVSPRFIAETMSKRIMKMWNLNVNPKGQMVDARGAAEGLVKELLEVIADKFEFISIHDIPTRFTKTINGKVEVVTTPTINVKGLNEVQKKIGLAGRDSVQRLLSPEEDNSPSFGKKITHVAKKNRRGTVTLSRRERNALRAQQDVPHLLAKGISELIGVIGFKTYGKMLGYQNVDHLGKNHPLRNSINGKNLSIERDWDDAHSVTAELQGDNQETKVYFNISITKVGRHQHSGINSQNNKTLRVMVSPTNATLDMTNQDDIDGFWLTVAQSSQLFKVENVLHEEILADIQGEFAKKFGVAQKLIEDYLNTGKMDSDALFDATGEISMEQLNAIFAVATLKNVSQKTNALTKFHTTLGFELDGKTDGPSHMMNNFGQGLLSIDDYMNFKRVGMFLGTTLETLNSFFSKEDNKDLYNETSVRGMNKMYADMANARPVTKAALFASARFAERFGDFILGPDGLPEMTRDSTKNAMTKTVYGAGLTSVSKGIAEDMIMGFYKVAVNMPKNADAAEYFGYPQFEADFALLFLDPYPKGVDWSQSAIDKRSRKNFEEIIEESIGSMIANSAKEVIGKPITRVADLLVFITNVQTEFMIMLYNKNLLELAETRAKEGAIKRSRKRGDPVDNSANTGPGIQRQLSVEDFKSLKDEIEGYGPTYENGVQTLAVGAFSPQPSNQELSATMEGKLQIKSTMDQPELARVKVIPYMTQGRGDAMVVNEIFGGKDAPGDILAVHDGFYVPINKIKEYSRTVNSAVMKTWDRDVLGDAVEDFERFAAKIKHGEMILFELAMEKVKKYPYESTIRDDVETGGDLMNLLKGFHRGNAARKAVFKNIPLSINHLGGAQEAAVRNEGEELDRHEINKLIAKKLGIAAPSDANKAFEADAINLERNEQINHINRLKAAAGMKASIDKAAVKDNTEIIIPDGKNEDGHDGVLITDTETLLSELSSKSNRLTIRETVKILRILMANKNYKVVIAKDRKLLIDQYIKDVGEKMSDFHRKSLDKSVVKGWVDVNSKTMYLTSKNHETLVHEMMHVATYQAIIAHYDGTKINAAIPRLEALMKQFMDIDYDDSNPALKRAANSAKATILYYQTKRNTINKGAALSEFLAWTLSTASLVKDLKIRDSVLLKMFKKVKILIKRIMGKNISDDMYKHILFNTVMLDAAWAQRQLDAQKVIDLIKPDAKDKAVKVEPLAEETTTEQLPQDDGVSLDEGSSISSVTERAETETVKETPSKIVVEEEKTQVEEIIDSEDDSIPPSVGDGGNINGVGNDNNNNGNDGGDVTPAAAQRTNFWINLIRKKLGDIKTTVDNEAATQQFRRYQKAAVKAVNALDFGGFVLDEYQKHTFRAIHMVLATEMRLNTQSGIALNQMFEHITTNLTPEMFGKGKHGQELYSAVMDLLGDTKNDEGVSDAMAILLALSQTSNKFREALDQLPDPGKEKINDGTLNGFLTSITGIMMNKALGTINIADSGAKDVLDVLARNLIREDTEREYTLLRVLMGSLDKADKFMSGGMNLLAERAAQTNQNVKNSDRALVTKLIASTYAASTAFLSSDRASILAEGTKRITHMGIAFDHAVFLREFVTEVVGADSTNAEVMMMLDRTNYAVQAIRQDFKEQLPVIMQNTFKKHPNEEQWKAFHRVLGSLDFAHLFDVSNPERAFNLLKDASLLSSKTVEAETEITSHFSKEVSDNILEKAKQLAGSMNLKGAGHQILWNAHAINKLSGNYDETMTDAIDTLVSLYALEIADQAQKDLIIDVYENDPEAVQNLVTYVQALNKEEDMKEFSEGAKMQGRKGWIPDHGKSNAQVVIQRDDKGDEMIKMGYIRVGDVKADVLFSTVKRGYYTTTVKQGTAYSQGVLQSVQGTYRGVNSVTGISIAPNVNGVITGSVLSIITSHMNDTGKVTDDKEVLAPVFDEKGEVWAYERIINPDLLDKHTQPKANMALMLGAWAGRQVEEKLASQYNFELLTELKRIYDGRKLNDDKLFIDISDPKLKDAVYRDSWRVISPETRKQIITIFGEDGGFMIRKDMVNLSLGYSDPTILDVWTGKTRMPKSVQKVIQAAAKVTMGDKAVTILSRSEEGIQGVIAGAKDLIVVRSLIVPYMNTQANVVQLMTRDVSLKTMIKGYKDKMAELERFNENTMRLMKIKTQIALAGNNKNKVAILKSQAQVILDENLRMSIAPLIAAGQYKNISEGITELDVELTSGRMKEWIENQVNKLPGPLQTITKYGLLSKDTAIYKMANKAVQYGDFLAKAIYYDHLTQVKGLSGEVALKRINEEYVNFSVLPGRTRSHLEAMGATWFLTFKIRTMKVALNVMRENPARALILMGSGLGAFGSPTNDNLGTVIIQDRFGYSVGWTMLLGSPELNPWAQLWGWS